MRDYKKYVSYSQVKELIKQLNTYDGVESYQIYGCLLDNYLFDLSDTSIRIGATKHRNYLILTEHYLNEWSSDYQLLLTDNENYYNTFVDEYNKGDM